MGSLKQAALEEQSKQDERTQRPDWPRCVRCNEPIDFDLVELVDDVPAIWTSCCSYCRHVAGGE